MIDHLLEPDLGISKKEQDELHKFAEGYKTRKANEAELEANELRLEQEREVVEKSDLIQDLSGLRNEFQRADKLLGRDGRRAIKVNEHWVVLERTYDRLRMAITSQIFL